VLAAATLGWMSEPPLPDRPASEQVSLTAHQAFLVMADFIWSHAQSAGDDLITLLGDTTIEADGQPADPAAWTDWLRSVDRILEGKPLRPGG
jgi:hypothetical protein